MIRPFRALCLAAALGAGPLHAADIDALNLLNQSEFLALSKDLGAALSYKPLTPAEPLGIIGFDVGVAVSGTKIRNSELLDRVTSNGNLPSYLLVPTLRAYKGLPFDLDVGVMVSAIPSSNIRLWGGELRYSVLSGNVALPAVAIRGSYTRVTGVEQLDFNTKGLDVSVSKGFLNLTPYGGVGRVWVSSTPNGVGLAKETFGLNKVFAGLNVSFVPLNLVVEADRTGNNTTFSVKAGLRF